MHCIKTINIERDYGSTRFYLWAIIVFTVVFCLTYIGTSFHYKQPHQSNYLLYFLASLLLLYPTHKFFHIFLLIIFKKPMIFKLKRSFYIMPVIHVRLMDLVSKRLYSWALLLPFLCLNSLFLFFAIKFPAYAHYFSILLALHCSICLIDLLFFKQLLHAPKNAFIEETPKGYEILVPNAKN